MEHKNLLFSLPLEIQQSIDNYKHFNIYLDRMFQDIEDKEKRLNENYKTIMSYNKENVKDYLINFKKFSKYGITKNLQLFSNNAFNRKLGLLRELHDNIKFYITNVYKLANEIEYIEGLRTKYDNLEFVIDNQYTNHIIERSFRKYDRIIKNLFHEILETKKLVVYFYMCFSKNIDIYEKM